MMPTISWFSGETLRRYGAPEPNMFTLSVRLFPLNREAMTCERLHRYVVIQLLTCKKPEQQNVKNLNS